MCFYVLCRNSTWAYKNDEKTNFEKSGQLTLQLPWGSKILSKWLYLVHTEIKDGRQKVTGKRFLGKVASFFSEKLLVESTDTLGVKKFAQIALSRTVSKINAVLRFMLKFKMATKSGRKTIFGKIHQLTLQIAWGSKLLLKLLYLAPFLRCVFYILRRNSRWLPKMAA